MKKETIASNKRKIHALSQIINKKRNEIYSLEQRAKELEVKKYSGKCYAFWSGTVAKCIDGKFIGFKRNFQYWLFSNDIGIELKNIRQSSIISEDEYKKRCEYIISQIRKEAGL